MDFREARRKDIDQMHEVRMSVRENTLSDPSLISREDYIEFLEERGKGWVGMLADRVVGFTIIDVIDKNIWALFVDPQFERMGIGRGLHERMLAWYFSHHQAPLWLGTEPNSRAADFYRKAGWVERGKHGKSEVRFEYTPFLYPYLDKKANNKSL